MPLPNKNHPAVLRDDFYLIYLLLRWLLCRLFYLQLLAELLEFFGQLYRLELLFALLPRHGRAAAQFV